MNYKTDSIQDMIIARYKLNVFIDLASNVYCRDFYYIKDKTSNCKQSNR